jgi:hypothetical protein
VGRVGLVAALVRLPEVAEERGLGATVMGWRRPTRKRSGIKWVLRLLDLRVAADGPPRPNRPHDAVALQGGDVPPDPLVGED